MAHDPRYIPFLLGTGIRTFSVDPQFLPRVQETIMGIRMEDAEAYAGKMLKETRISGAQKVLETRPRIQET